MSIHDDLELQALLNSGQLWPYRGLADTINANLHRIEMLGSIIRTQTDLQFCKVTFLCSLVSCRVNGKLVALKVIRLQEEEGTPFTAIREGRHFNLLSLILSLRVAPSMVSKHSAPPGMPSVAVTW